MREFFNDYVQSIETYIMFRIKETVAKITPELIAKGRAPIALSMGAPTANPPQKVINDLTNAKVLPYIYNMDEMLNISDLVICRSGAMTVTEISIVRKAGNLYSTSK